MSAECGRGEGEGELCCVCLSVLFWSGLSVLSLGALRLKF